MTPLTPEAIAQLVERLNQWAEHFRVTEVSEIEPDLRAAASALSALAAERDAAYHRVTTPGFDPDEIPA